MSQELDQQQNQQNENGKVDKKFEQNMAKMMSMLSGNYSAFKTKIPNDKMGEVVSKLLEKRSAAAIEKFMEEASQLLDDKVAFDRFVSQQEKALKEAVTNKKKELNKKFEAVFGLIDNVDKLHGDYMRSLKELTTGEDDTQEESQEA
jgi:hypothetical protein